MLQACPDITGVTLRTHYESGVREGSYAFWKTIFEGVPRSGRQLEIELHAKGLDQRMIDGALSTGMPVRLSAKYNILRGTFSKFINELPVDWHPVK